MLSLLVLAVLCAPLKAESGKHRARTQVGDHVIVTFLGSHANGEFPGLGLIADRKGDIFGTVSDYGCGCTSVGSVFELTATPSGYAYKTLYTFQSGGLDGNYPVGPLAIDAHGALYGTTVAGGTGGQNCTQGCGTVFKLIPKASGYSERVLYRFEGDGDGARPYGALLIDAKGNLIGTTFDGASGCAPATNCGVVFKLAPNGATGYAFSVAFTFDNPNFANNPTAGVIADRSGALYGTAAGGPGSGIAFKLTPTGSEYSETILHAFGKDGDGSWVDAGLTMDAAGALYGTTVYGGGGKCNEGSGCGVAFKLTGAASGYEETIIHSFSGGAPDGAYPSAALVVDERGNVFGTAGGGTPGATFDFRQPA